MSDREESSPARCPSRSPSFNFPCSLLAGHDGLHENTNGPSIKWDPEPSPTPSRSVVGCPTCHAPAGEPCVNTAVGGVLREPDKHWSRDAAEVPVLREALEEAERARAHEGWTAQQWAENSAYWYELAQASIRRAAEARASLTAAREENSRLKAALQRAAGKLESAANQFAAIQWAQENDEPVPIIRANPGLMSDAAAHAREVLSDTDQEK